MLIIDRLNKYYGSVSGAMLKVIRVRRNIGLGEDCYDVLEEFPMEILLLSDDAAQCLHHARVISTILLGFVTLLLVANHELIVGYYLLLYYAIFGFCIPFLRNIKKKLKII